MLDYQPGQGSFCTLKNLQQIKSQEASAPSINGSNSAIFSAWPAHQNTSPSSSIVYHTQPIFNHNEPFHCHWLAIPSLWFHLGYVRMWPSAWATLIANFIIVYLHILSVYEWLGNMVHKEPSHPQKSDPNIDALERYIYLVPTSKGQSGKISCPKVIAMRSAPCSAKETFCCL